MSHEILGLKNMAEFLETDHTEILEKIDQLKGAMVNLRFEGKVSYGKNLKVVEELLTILDSKFLKRLQLMEGILYPFIESHIPKLDPVLRLLKAENKELKVNLEVMIFLLDQIKAEKIDMNQAKFIEQLKDKVTYLMYLLHNHFEVEAASVYKVIKEDLHEDEKDLLLKKMKKNDENLS